MTDHVTRLVPRLAALLSTLCFAAACAGVPIASSPVPTSMGPFASPSSPPTIVPTAPTATPTAAPTLTRPPGLSALTPAEAPAGFVSQIRCEGPIGESDPVALVRINATSTNMGEMVLRDYADTANPRTACTFLSGPTPELLDARHALVRGCGQAGTVCQGAVVDLPEVQYHWYAAPQPPDDGWGGDVAVSPTGDSIAWIRWHPNSPSRSLWVTDAMGDHEVMVLPDSGGRCGSPYDSDFIAFSHSGQHFYILDQQTLSLNTLAVVAGHELVMSLIPPAAGWPAGDAPTMALWSPTSETLFYGKSGDIWRWTESTGAEVFLHGVSWFNPTITPDGTHLAYADWHAAGSHDIYLLDLAAAGPPERIARGRSGPVFLNNSQLWYLSEVGAGCATEEVPRPLIFDISARTESNSIVDAVYGTWPATSSSF